MIVNFHSDPYGSRLVGLIYGRQKIGKTTAALNLIRHGCRLIFFSYDRGVRPAFQQLGFSDDEAKKMLVFYPGVTADGIRTPDVVKDTKAELAHAGERAAQMIKKGLSPSKLWLIFDTFSHFQARALSEARRIVIGQQSASRVDRDVRDAITQVDYNVNLGQMRDVIDIALSIPCNILFICHEKVDRELRDKPRAHPNLIGATYGHLVGDVDYCFRMVIENGKRVFHTKPEDDEEAGHRLGHLEAVEPADIWAVYQKMTAIERKEAAG